MPDIDGFTINIEGARNLVGSNTNKTFTDSLDEGVEDIEEDYLSIDLSDEELLKLRDQYEQEWAGYFPKVKSRMEKNKMYLVGRQNNAGAKDVPVANNQLFQATATFIPASLAKDPEPVVWSDNTPDGKQASSELKTWLQYQAKELRLIKKLGVMVWHWSANMIAVLKYGWDEKIGEVTMQIRKPKNFIFQPDGYVDEYGHFEGWLGERIKVKAKRLIELFPKHKAYISEKVNDKLGTFVTYTEWWDDEMCFSTFENIVLEAHKNEFFNYPEKPETDLSVGEEEQQPITQAHNHFEKPFKPYTFLSVFSLQEEPFDFTNLIEQNIANQDRIVARDIQIDKNLRQGNNSLIVSGISFNQEVAHQAAQGMEDGDPILIPDGKMDSVQRVPANKLPDGLLEAQEYLANNLQNIYGTQGLAASPPDTDQTAHGMVINTNRDTSRIGGGMGDALETVARSAFNYLTQISYVFYDEAHFAAIMGNGAAVSYVMLQMQDQSRRFIVDVSPNSMQPKDEVSEQNLATQLMEAGLLDPLSFFERINSPDPQEDALKLMIYKTNPMQYIQQFLSPENLQGGQGVQQSTAPPTPNQPPETNPSLSAGGAQANLNQPESNISNAKPQT